MKRNLACLFLPFLLLPPLMILVSLLSPWILGPYCYIRFVWLKFLIHHKPLTNGIIIIKLRFCLSKKLFAQFSNNTLYITGFICSYYFFLLYFPIPELVSYYFSWQKYTFFQERSIDGMLYTPMRNTIFLFICIWLTTWKSCTGIDRAIWCSVDTIW